MTVRRRWRVLRLITPALVAPVLAVSAITAVPISAAAQDLATRPGAAPLTQTQALARAEATGQPVTITAMTTPTSTTTANPDGSYTADESAGPVRAWRNGGWVALDPTLHANPDGTISPAVTTSGLVLSGGGSAPLATMRAAGRKLALSLPQTLPAPTLSGATATYPAVLPGVDLVVTADDQGGFSEVLVVKNATAAQNPALTSLRLAVSAPGLTVSADQAGDLTAAASASAAPLFTAPVPLMWDSTSPTASQVANAAAAPAPGDPGLAPPSGLPVTSSAAGPGVAAHVTTVPLTAAPGTVTLTPPSSALTGSAVTYPVYIDPTWHAADRNASAWTQVDKGYPTTTYWKESSDLQVGKCDFAGCNNVQVARTFLQFPIPSVLVSTTVVHDAELYMDNTWSADGCTATPAQLWTTNGISSSTNWNNQPSWNTEVQQKSFASGSSGCGSMKNDVTWQSSELTTIMQRDATNNYTTQTFGIRAADETNDLQWKQFHSGNGDGWIHLTVNYDNPPNKPADRASSPGGGCKYSASVAPTIGNDDVTLYATISDDDNDNSLSTQFYLKNSSGTTVYTPPADVVGNNTVAQVTLTRAKMQSLGGDGQEHTYHWYAVVTDPFGQASAAPDNDCYFKYNPAAPGAPVVTLSAASGQLGQQITASFDAPSGTCPGSACPVQYTYQLSSGTPVTVSADANGNWDNHSITIPQIGPITVTVAAISAGGNPGEAATPQIDGTAPAAPYADGDFNGDGQPDLLTLGTSAAKPSLWLSPGTGAGTIGNALDIGGAGTTINPGTDGPADWAGAQVLHGDFTAHDVQDVLAYYPSGTHAGAGAIIAGNGIAAPLVPSAGNVSNLNAGIMAAANGDDPVKLTAAGNASEIGTGVDDLIGISGDSTSPDDYELDLFTNGFCTGCEFSGGYGWTAVLSTTAPAGSWHDYTLATVQLPDTSHPRGNPASTALLALNTVTGALWESTNPGQAGCPNDGLDYTQAGCTVIGSPGSTWTHLAVPWGSSPPGQISADINTAGKVELWAITPTTATAYTLTGTTLSSEATDTVAHPYNDWPLAEGTGTTTSDTIASHDAALNSGATWTDDNDSGFDNYITLDGATGYVTPPAGTIPSTATTPKISIWFRTTTADGVLVSISGTALSPGGTAATYDPVLYVGTDGHLYGEWWNGVSPASPARSAAPVDDGLWHHAYLTAYASTQTLYLDSQAGVTISGSVNISGQGSHLYFGAGYTGGNWPSEPHYKNTNAPDYFNGDIAAFLYSYPGGP